MMDHISPLAFAFTFLSCPFPFSSISSRFFFLSLTFLSQPSSIIPHRISSNLAFSFHILFAYLHQNHIQSVSPFSQNQPLVESKS
jgi:hypothetical protein